MKKTRREDCRVVIRVTPEEKKKMYERCKELHFESFSSYARLMLLDGLIINVDYSVISDLKIEESRIGNNLNQIARKLNSFEEVTSNDLKEIQQLLERLIKVQLKTHQLLDPKTIHSFLSF